MKKTYVIDTNVLIHDPDCIFRFEDNLVVIPYPVIEELDALKKAPNGKAFAARKAIRNIDSLLTSNQALKKTYGYKINLPGEGKLVITGKWYYEKENPDDIILKYLRSISGKMFNEFPQPVILVTKDISFRVRATLEGHNAEDYRTDKTLSFQKYGEIQLGKLDIKSVYYFENSGEIYKAKNSEIFKVKSKSLLSVIPKNCGQTCAADALLDTDIDLVVLNGYAGTGKTLLALAAGVLQTLKGFYERVVVLRPVVPIPGTDIGYLPGDVKEKLNPWMQPIYDNLDLISLGLINQTGKNKKKANTNLEEIVQVQALTFIRGRSLPNSFIIIDEGQNLRPLDVKTIVTRAGEGSKIVFTGDLEQIDTPYLDATSSGLAYLVDRFINEPNFCYLNLKETVRSRLAEQGVRLLQ